MPGQIVVPLKGSDRIQSFIPYIEQIAQPGMEVVFFVHYRVNNFYPLIQQLLAFEGGILFPAKTKDPWNSQNCAVEEEIRSACSALVTRGVEPRVLLYKGRLSKVINEYVPKHDVRLVMMQPNGTALTRFTRRIGGLIRLSTISAVPSVLLFQPTQTTERYRRVTGLL
jgi:hypothetical protein